MGGASKWKKNRPSLVYHHTSTLRTNLIWMAGVIEVEGQHGTPFHPHLGIMQTDVRFRRACKDFPPVAWFTSDINVPKCLIETALFFVDPETGEKSEVRVNGAMSNAISLRRMALGFHVADIPVTPWPEHAGYQTPEGKELNETAIECGDDPTCWYVSEAAVSLDYMREIRVAKAIDNLKMEKHDWYLGKIQELRERYKEEKAYILPTWLSKEDGEALAIRLNVKMMK